ncbi:Gluconate 2-dehydrogenase [Pseudomonas savastanoi pv. glycinea]|nr:Gluconate 2-dehydrogenase [Pseudomonas savastanoi pv. glycinea]
MKTSLSRPTIFARTLKRVRFSTAAFAILAGTLAIGLAQAQENIPAPAVEKVGSPSSPEEQGRRLAVAGDCMACHTVPDSDKPFAGGYAINSPFGAIFSTNITPSKQAGIGLYTEQEFAEAVRKGIRRDGGHLYPAMPYTSYVHMTDSDVSALYAYFMHSVEPVDVPAPKTALAFPFNLRFSMIGWNLLFLDNPTTLRAPLATPQIQRGEYLTNTLEHCGACHTPRNPLMAEITSKALSGGMVGPWFAPNITSDPISGIGGWTDAELIGYLRTGHATGKGQAGGGMAEAVQNSLQFLPDGDLAAIVAYLKSTAPVRNAGETRPRYDYGKPNSGEAELRGTASSTEHDSLHSGAALHSGYCSSCHQPNGAGSPNQTYPSLVHNTATGGDNSANLVAAILYGVDRREGGRHVLMPRFDELSYVGSLSDQQIADIATYVLRSFGNSAQVVTAHEVAVAREGGEQPMLAVIQPYIIPAMGIGLLLIALLWVLYLRRRSIKGGVAKAEL